MDLNANNIKKIPTEIYFSIIKESLQKTGTAAVRVTGVSMKSFLFPVRDTISLIAFDPEAKKNDTFKKGDIVLFDTKRGRYILHRVTKVYYETDKTPFMFNMRGDNTDSGENNYPCSEIVGIVNYVIRNGKKIERNSFVWNLYKFLAPFRLVYRFLWYRTTRRVLAKIYRFFFPRKPDDTKKD